MDGNERARRYRARKRGEDIPIGKPGPKRGFKQSFEHVQKRSRWGSDHHAWKGDAATKKAGRSRARRWFKLRPCVKCGARGTDRHHKDGNPMNNRKSNVEILCEYHHILAHGHKPSKECMK